MRPNKLNLDSCLETAGDKLEEISIFYFQGVCAEILLQEEGDAG